jgi:signal transduction histidine kinase
MKTVSGTVEKMTALMTKLSVGATSPGDGRPMTDEAADVRATVVDIIENMNEDGSARVQFLSEEVLPPVRMRQEQLHQVLLNILLNARQACSGSALIRVSAAKATNTVQITISDNGPGIPGTVLRTLFQPFRTTKSGGLGVGLYQCRRMVESQQGSLRVESQVGQGTRVHIRLPCLTEAQHAVHV